MRHKMQSILSASRKLSNKRSWSSQTTWSKSFVSKADHHPVHHFFSSHSSPNAISISHKIYGSLSNPLHARHVFTNTHFKGFINSKPKTGGFPRPQLQTRSFQLSQSSYSHRTRWWRSQFPRLTTDGVIWGLILVNGAVFMLWRYADRIFMEENFMISLDNVRSGRVHTMITSAFSHYDVGHIVSNMIGLYFFGNDIGRNFGPKFLLKLYLSGAFVGSVFFLVQHAFMSSSSRNKRMGSIDPSRISGLGASGATNAIMLLDIFLFPKSTIYLEFIIPVPAMLLGIFLIGKDMLNILEGDSKVSGAAHLGGAVVAAIAWARIRRGRF